MANRKGGKRKFIKKRKMDPVSRAKKSYVRLKPTSLMVNPSTKNRSFMPMQYRTTLNITHNAREAIGSNANYTYFVWLNNLHQPFNTSIPAQGVMIDGSPSTALSACPTGFLSIIGDGAVAGIYNKYCVLNVSYKITYFPLGLIDAMAIVALPERTGTVIGSISTADEYPYSKGPIYCVGYNSTKNNTISGKINLAKFLGYSSDQEYASQTESTGTRTVGPPTGPSTAQTNLVALRILRCALNGNALTSALPYSIQMKYDVLFTRTAEVLSE